MTGDLDSRPPRPFLPPLLVAGLVLWAATALIWPTLRLAPTAALPVLGMLALGAAVWLASHALRAARGGGFSLGALAALSLAAAVALCSFWGGALRGSMAYAEAQGGDLAPVTWHAELTEDARRGDFGWHAEARLRGADGRVLRVRLNLPEDAALLQGQSMTVSGTLKPPAEAVAAYYWDTGLAGSLTASESAFVSEEAALDSAPFVHLRRCALDLIAACGGDNAPLLQALVCGWRPAIEESGLYDCFKAGDLEGAQAAQDAIAILQQTFKYGNPNTIIKTAVALQGHPVGKCRAPFNYVPEEGMEAIKKVLAENEAKGLH